MNRFLINAHTVPLTDLITLNVLIVVLIAYGFRYMGWCNGNACIGVLVGLLVLSIVLHSYMGIPDNLSYFFGWGARPIGWRGV